MDVDRILVRPEWIRREVDEVRIQPLRGRKVVDIGTERRAGIPEPPLAAVGAPVIDGLAVHEDEALLEIAGPTVPKHPGGRGTRVRREGPQTVPGAF